MAELDILLDFTEEMRKQLGLSEEWEYRSLPFMTEELYYKLMDIFGKDNVRIMSGMSKPDPDDETNQKVIIRASIFINAQAIENLKKYSSTVET